MARTVVLRQNLMTATKNYVGIVSSLIQEAQGPYMLAEPRRSSLSSLFSVFLPFLFNSVTFPFSVPSCPPPVHSET